MLPPPAPTAVVQANQTTSTETRGEEKGSDSSLEQKLLGPEVKALRECLIVRLVKLSLSGGYI
jgi:hypothetical protein